MQWPMPIATTMRVSRNGQVSLPADAGRRWGTDLVLDADALVAGLRGEAATDVVRGLLLDPTCTAAP